MRSHKQEQNNRRSEPRSASHCAALAFRSDGRRSEVTVRNMSLSGLQIEGDAFADNDEFRLVIPQRGDINARVLWASSGKAGARFDEDLVLNDVVHPRDSYTVRRLRAYTFTSGRVFGKRGSA